MTTLERLEARRRRGLDEVRDLQGVQSQRPLLGFEERSLHRSRCLVAEMDDAIRALQCEEAGQRCLATASRTSGVAAPGRPF